MEVLPNLGGRMQGKEVGVPDVASTKKDAPNRGAGREGHGSGHRRKYGGATGTRTRDLMHAMHALYQLSYGPMMPLQRGRTLHFCIGCTFARASRSRLRLDVGRFTKIVRRMEFPGGAFTKGRREG